MNGIGYAVLILQNQVSSGTIIHFGRMYCTFDISMSQICYFLKSGIIAKYLGLTLKISFEILFSPHFFPLPLQNI